MSFSLEKVWSDLHYEEKIYNQWRKRKKIRELTVGIAYVILAHFAAFLSFFSYAACFTEKQDFKKIFPVEAVWDFFEKPIIENSEKIIENAMLATVGVILFLIIFGVIVRLFTIKVKVPKTSKPMPENREKAMNEALEWVKKLDDKWDVKSKRFWIFNAILMVGIGVLITLSALICKNGTANEEQVSNLIFVGIYTFVIFLVLTGSLKVVTVTPIPNEQESYTLKKSIEKQIAKEEKEREAAEKENARQEKIQKGIDLFLKGEYAEAKKLFKNFTDSKCGDVVAIKILCDKKKSESTNALRDSYDVLWKAKDLGFYNSEIRKAVDYALDAITPKIHELALPDMLKIYQNYLDGYDGSVVYECEKHVEYGYPDAIVIQIFTKIKNEHTNNPNRYPEWLEKVKLAKRRGFSVISEDVADEIIERLEATIRYNEQIEKENKRRESEISFTPSLYTSGPLSSWAEPSGWTDFRTGEPLYRVEGRIVNGNGEEVSAAWWE